MNGNVNGVNGHNGAFSPSGWKLEPMSRFVDGPIDAGTSSPPWRIFSFRSERDGASRNSYCGSNPRKKFTNPNWIGIYAS